MRIRVGLRAKGNDILQERKIKVYIVDRDQQLTKMENVQITTLNALVNKCIEVGGGIFENLL
jgi:hypothetical protein